MQCLLYHYMIFFKWYCMNRRRLSFMLQSDLHRKLRLLQADELKKQNSAVSLSSIINSVLRRGLK